MFCLAQLEVYHLLLILKIGEVAVALLKKASSMIVRPWAYGGVCIDQNRYRLVI